LFEGAGGIEPPKNADYSGVTDPTGKAIFDVSGFFRVAISNGRYEAVHEENKVPEKWKDIYSAWGAVGVLRDITYDFPLKAVAPPPGKWWIAVLAILGTICAGAYLLKGGE